MKFIDHGKVFDSLTHGNSVFMLVGEARSLYTTIDSGEPHGKISGPLLVV